MKPLHTFLESHRNRGTFAKETVRKLSAEHRIVFECYAEAQPLFSKANRGVVCPDITNKNLINMTKAEKTNKRGASGTCSGSPERTRLSREQIEKKKSLARTLYLSGMEQQEIAEKVDVSRVTISKWCSAEGWKEARAAKNITRPELVNKLLLTIDTLITQVNDSNDPALIAGLGDKLAKLSSVIEKLDKKANVVDAIEVFMAFSKWLEYRSQTDPEVTPELMRVINKYQDMYITEQMGIK